MSRLLSYFKTKSLAEKLCVMGLFLLPYDALPVMPTHYRPVSVYFFTAAFILFFFLEQKTRIAFDGISKWLIYFLAYSIPAGIATSLYYGNPLANVADHFAVFLMGLFTYLSLAFFFNRYNSVESTIDQVTDILSYAYTLPIIVCVIEMLAIYTPFPVSIKHVLNSIFGGWQANRICGSSSETSWMALHLLTIMPVLYYRGFYRGERGRSFLFVGAAASFLACVSLKGFLILAIACVIFYLHQSAINKNLAGAVLKLLLLIVCLWGGFCLLHYAASQMESSYFTIRILNFSTSLSLRDILFLDGSVFIRCGFPLIAFQIFFDHPLFGTGAGSFAFMFRDYLLANFREALNYGEVLHYFKTGTSANTTIYAKVFSEFGLIGALLYLRFYCSAILNSSIPRNSAILFWAAILLALPFQQGSYAYLPMWVGLAFFSSSKSIEKGI